MKIVRNIKEMIALLIIGKRGGTYTMWSRNFLLQLFAACAPTPTAEAPLEMELKAEQKDVGQKTAPVSRGSRGSCVHSLGVYLGAGRRMFQRGACFRDQLLSSTAHLKGLRVAEGDPGVETLLQRKQRWDKIDAGWITHLWHNAPVLTDFASTFKHKAAHTKTCEQSKTSHLAVFVTIYKKCDPQAGDEARHQTDIWFVISPEKGNSIFHATALTMIMERYAKKGVRPENLWQNTDNCAGQYHGRKTYYAGVARGPSSFGVSKAYHFFAAPSHFKGPWDGYERFRKPGLGGTRRTAKPG
jgi:hypothetical protein